MQHDIRHCHDKGFQFQVEAECCFRISEKYWELLRNDLGKLGFSSLTDEILFFKEIKPKFIAESEYYRLLNYAANFCPDDAFPRDQKNFWIRQLSRLEKFKIQHEQFWIYHSSGQTEKDEVFFTRGNPHHIDYSDHKAASGFDELTGQLMARQRYAAFAQDKLSACLQNQP